MVIHHFNRLIRNKWVWGVFAVLISAFFAFDFLFARDNDGRGAEGAGKLSDETISRMRFEEARQDVLAPMRLQYGRNVQIKDSHLLNKQVWSRLAMLKVADGLKIKVDDDQVRTAIRQMFTDETGAFNQMRYQEFCANLEWKPEQFEAFFRRNLSISPVQSVVATASWASPLEISNAVRDETDKITVRIARFEQAPDMVKAADLDDAAFKEYYESHTNSLALPELKVIRYVEVPADDAESLAKVEVDEDDLQDFRDKNKYGTNETDRAQSEHDFRLKSAVEAARDALYACVCPEGVADDGVDRLAQLAAEKKLEIKTSRPFAQSDAATPPFGEQKYGFMVRAGFMVDASEVLPVEEKEFVNGMKDIESDRYRAICGSNAVYVVGLAEDLCTKPRVLSLDEIKGNPVIRAAALDDLKAKEFKKAVDKVRDAVKVGIAAHDGKFDPKLFVDANVSTSLVVNVSTSITFVAQTEMPMSPYGRRARAGAFADADLVVPAAQHLKTGELSEFVPNAYLPSRGVVVYVENRESGVVGDAFDRMRSGLSRRQGALAEISWNESNMARLGVQPNAWTSMKEMKDNDEADDGEGSQD